MLGLFTVIRLPVRELDYQSSLRAHVRAVLVDDAEPEEHLRTLIALLSSLKAVATVVNATDGPMSSHVGSRAPRRGDHQDRVAGQRTQQRCRLRDLGSLPESPNAVQGAVLPLRGRRRSRASRARVEGSVQISGSGALQNEPVRPDTAVGRSSCGGGFPRGTPPGGRTARTPARACPPAGVR